MHRNWEESGRLVRKMRLNALMAMPRHSSQCLVYRCWRLCEYAGGGGGDST